MAIAAAYYSQSQSFSLNSFWASILIGLSTSLILFCSHFHQLKDDILAGKKSPIVRLGTAKSSQILHISVIGFYGLTALFIGMGVLPLASSLVILSLPIALKLIQLVRNNHNQPEQVKHSKFVAVNLHFVSGLLLSLGLIFHNWQ
jgi:1,4-dihydroxy-2-naphthoate octaprenyltransferase